MKVFLTGFMAAGKSVVGLELSRLVEVPFLDLDAEIEKQAGKSVAEIFEEGGEPAFRRLEKRALERTIDSKCLIVAVGGGAVVDLANRRLMRQSGTVVWLDADLELILDRLQKAGPGRRPLASSQAELRALYRRRQEAYGDCDQRVEIEAEEAVDAVAARVLRRLGDPKCGT